MIWEHSWGLTGMLSPHHKYIYKLLIWVNVYLEYLMSYSLAKIVSSNEPAK